MWELWSDNVTLPNQNLVNTTLIFSETGNTTELRPPWTIKRHYITTRTSIPLHAGPIGRVASGNMGISEKTISLLFFHQRNTPSSCSNVATTTVTHTQGTNKTVSINSLMSMPRCNTSNQTGFFEKQNNIDTPPSWSARWKNIFDFFDENFENQNFGKYFQNIFSPRWNNIFDPDFFLLSGLSL